ncbi:hypothetical protein LUZ60_015991 [Juncus effusus]|nr:hypothetical protein LUZ60_015991 [Juncus effusus]
MSLRSIFHDIKDSIGSLSRRSFEVRISVLPRSAGSGLAPHESEEEDPITEEEGKWSGVPPELLRDVVRRLEESEDTWPNRKNVVACAAVCRSWRMMCKEMVISPEFCGKLTFPVSLKQPGPRDGSIQCFIKRDKAKLTYHLYLCLSPAVLVENGKFLLSAKRTRRTAYTEYIISMDADNITRSSNTYIGKMRSNFLGTKFIIYDTEAPPHNATSSSSSATSAGRTSRRFSKKVSPKLLPSSSSSSSPNGSTRHASYRICDVSYELNVLGTRGPRRMRCVMHSVPASCMDPNGSVPARSDPLITSRNFEDSFRSMTTTGSMMDRSMDFSSARFSDIMGGSFEGETRKELPLVLRNKAPRWHEQLQCWCLNFRGRVTVASVKNFQLIAAVGPTTGGPQMPAGPPTGVVGPTGSQTAAGPGPGPGPGVGAGPGPAAAGATSSSSDQDKIILQFGKVAKDMFTMDYRYPLSAFQAFAICLTSFDTKLACE